MDLLYSKWILFLHFSGRKLPLNKIKLNYKTTNKIVCDYVNQYGINLLTTFFKQYANVYQFVYSILFQSTFLEMIMMLYRADASSKQRL